MSLAAWCSDGPGVLWWGSCESLSLVNGAGVGWGVLAGSIAQLLRGQGHEVILHYNEMNDPNEMRCFLMSATDA